MRFTPVPDARPDDVPWPALVWPVPAALEPAGDRVRLTRLDPAADAPALFAALDDDRVWAHVPGRPRDPDDLARVLAGRAARPDWQQWLATLVRPVAGLAVGTVVGTTSYLDASPPDARLEVGATAWTPAVWGTAVNPESKLLLLGTAFDDLHAGRVQLKTDVRNARSQRAIARLGARHEGTLRRYQRRADGSVRDTVLFSVTADEWPTVRRGLRARLATSAQDPGGASVPPGRPRATPDRVRAAPPACPSPVDGAADPPAPFLA